MRIKELFTVPEGKKITEKMFGRVLISSVCSILLCMACLIGTTWAWFTVNIENTGNEIQIAIVKPIVTVTKDGNTPVSPADNTHYMLDAGSYQVEIQLDNNATGADDLNKTQRNELYVVMTATQGGVSESYCLVFSGTEESIACNLQIVGNIAEIRFAVSWIMPASATSIDSETVIIGRVP